MSLILRHKCFEIGWGFVEVRKGEAEGDRQIRDSCLLMGCRYVLGLHELISHSLYSRFQLFERTDPVWSLWSYQVWHTGIFFVSLNILVGYA